MILQKCYITLTKHLQTLVKVIIFSFVIASNSRSACKTLLQLVVTVTTMIFTFAYYVEREVGYSGLSEEAADLFRHGVHIKF